MCIFFMHVWMQFLTTSYIGPCAHLIKLSTPIYHITRFCSSLSHTASSMLEFLWVVRPQIPIEPEQEKPDQRPNTLPIWNWNPLSYRYFSFGIFALLSKLDNVEWKAMVNPKYFDSTENIFEKEVCKDGNAYSMKSATGGFSWRGRSVQIF